MVGAPGLLPSSGRGLPITASLHRVRMVDRRNHDFTTGLPQTVGEFSLQGQIAQPNGIVEDRLGGGDDRVPSGRHSRLLGPYGRNRPDALQLVHVDGELPRLVQGLRYSRPTLPDARGGRHRQCDTTGGRMGARRALGGCDGIRPFPTSQQ